MRRPLTHRKAVCKNLHITYPGYITFYNNIYGRRYASRNGITGIITYPLTRHHDVPLLFQNLMLLRCWRKNAEKKTRNNKKSTLLNLFPVDVLHVIENWITGIEYSTKFKTVVMQIPGPWNPVLCIATYEDHKSIKEFGNLSLYNTIRYEWADTIYKKSKHGWRPDSPYVRHIHEWMKWVTSRKIA